MNAKDFVKKHGWTAVIAAVKNTTAEETAAFESKELKYLDDNNPMLGVNIKVYAIPYNDVKTLVDAYELVQLFKGIDRAKMELEACGLNGFEQILVKLDVGVGYVRKHRLMKAIQLVESVDESN